METPLANSNAVDSQQFSANVTPDPASMASDDLLNMQDFLLEEIRLLRASLQHQIQVCKDECLDTVHHLVLACKEECLDSIRATQQDVREPMMPLRTQHLQEQNSQDMSAVASEMAALRQGLIHLQHEVAALLVVKTSREATLELSASSDQVDFGQQMQQEDPPTLDGAVEPAHAEFSAVQDSPQPVAVEPAKDERAPQPTPAMQHGFTQDLTEHLRKSNYELQESIWDYSLLIGLPETAVAGSCFLALLLTLNIFCQLALCLIINDTFTVAEITTDSVQGMRRWRSSYAHEISFINQFTFQPLVQSICSFEDGLPMHVPAATILNDITQYLPTEAYYGAQSPFIGPMLPYFERIGILLSLIAITIWTLNSLTALEDVHMNFRAVHYLPLASSTKIEHSTDSCALVCISMPRKICFTMILILQVFVIIVLGCAGFFYIINTTELKDLLLNCSALQIVLELDELIATFVPATAQRLLSSLEPLPRSPRKTFAGLSWNAIVKLTFMFVVVFLGWWVLEEEADVMRDVRLEICGGNQNFIVAQDKSGLVLAAESPYVVSPEQSFDESYIYNAVHQLVNDDKRVATGLSREDMSGYAGSLVGSPWSLVSWIDLGQEQVAGYWNPDCEDMLPIRSGGKGQDIHLAQILRDIAGSTIQHCSEVKQYCSSDNLLGVRTRQICPVTCSCNHPSYYLVLSGENGCPSSCTSSSMYTTSMSGRECSDMPLSIPVWADFANSLKGFMETYPDYVNETTLAQIRDNGCGLVSMQLNIIGRVWTDPCEYSSAVRLKPLTFACPVSCQCKTRDHYLCPHQCRAR